MNISVHLGDVTSSVIQANNQNFISINTENAYYSRNIGYPQLPQFNQLIEIPAESNCAGDDPKVSMNDIIAPSVPKNASPVNIPAPTINVVNNANARALSAFLLPSFS